MVAPFNMNKINHYFRIYLSFLRFCEYLVHTKRPPHAAGTPLQPDQFATCERLLPPGGNIPF
jgi:hypothetical protein